MLGFIFRVFLQNTIFTDLLGNEAEQAPPLEEDYRKLPTIPTVRQMNISTVYGDRTIG
jgi:hypothetical protein